MARTFNGLAANRLVIGNPAVLSITGVITVHAWAKIPSHKAGATAGAALSKWGGSSSGWGLDINDTGSAANARFFVADAAGALDIVSGATTLSLNTWYALTGTKNGTGAGSEIVYVNGAQDGTLASTRALAPSSFLCQVGVRGDNVDPGALLGDVAECAVWDVLLTTGEIAALGKGVCPLNIRRDHLRGYWPLFGVGYPEPDLSGNVNNATLTGTVPTANHAPVQPFASVAG